MTALEPWALPLAALIIAVAALALTVVTSHNSASSTYTEQLEHRIAHLEKELEKALALVVSTRQENTELRTENFDLLQRLFHASGGRRALPE